MRTALAANDVSPLLAEHACGGEKPRTLFQTKATASWWLGIADRKHLRDREIQNCGKGWENLRRLRTKKYPKLSKAALDVK